MYAAQSYIEAAKKSGDEILCGGTGDDSVGFYIQPTIIQCRDPRSTTMVNEVFGPLLSLYVYDDSQPDFWREICREVDTATDYGLTGAIFAKDRQALIDANHWLRYAAGNVYHNVKESCSSVSPPLPKPSSQANTLCCSSNHNCIQHLSAPARWSAPNPSLGRDAQELATRAGK